MAQGHATETRPLAASCAVALCGAAWGVYWLPLRYLQGLGLTGSWATAGFFLACLPMAIPLAVLARRELKEHGLSLVWLALGNGAVFSLYSNAYSHTSVFNVLFLFYLSPVWSVLIARFWLGERVGLPRMGCVLIGLVGLTIMLGAGDQWPIPRNVGDWMALVSGMLWAVVTIRIRRNQHIGAGANTVAFLLGGAGPALLFAVVMSSGDLPSGLTVVAALPVLIAVAWLGWVPSQLMLFWGVRRISPVRSGVLLMTELVSGAATAALLSGDPVSWRQIVGGVLILAAGLSDILTARDRVVPAPIPLSSTQE